MSAYAVGVLAASPAAEDNLSLLAGDGRDLSRSASFDITGWILRADNEFFIINGDWKWIDPVDAGNGTEKIYYSRNP